MADGRTEVTQPTRLAEFKVGLINGSYFAAVSLDCHRLLETPAKRPGDAEIEVVAEARPNLDDLDHHETHIRLMLAITNSGRPSMPPTRPPTRWNRRTRAYVAQQIRATVQSPCDWLGWNPKRHPIGGSGPSGSSTTTSCSAL